MKCDLSAEYVRSILDYDPRTGVLTWRVKLNLHTKIGAVAGSVHQSGYRVIGIGGSLYSEHRLAWLHFYGEWPNGELDHEDTVRSHNWITNLREATRSQNLANARPLRSNKSGYKGVYWSTRSGKWMAQIKYRGYQEYLGTFDDPKVAHEAYVRRAAEVFGDFARTT